MVSSSKATQTTLYLTGLGFALLSCVFSYRSPPLELKLDRQKHNITPRSDVIRYFSFGLKRALTDFIWIHTLLEGDLEHYSRKDLNSWMYLRFAGIIDLDPKFYEAYLYGSDYLNIVKNDNTAGEEILKRGLQIFPDDYDLNYRLGFIYAIERGNFKAAYPYFYRIRSSSKRPAFFDSLLAKVAAQSLNETDAMFFIAQTMEKHPKESEIHIRLFKQLYTLQATYDLKCLSEGRAGCKTTDLNGDPYIRTTNGWIANSPLVKTTLKIREQTETH